MLGFGLAKRGVARPTRILLAAEARESAFERLQSHVCAASDNPPELDSRDTRGGPNVHLGTHRVAKVRGIRCTFNATVDTLHTKRRLRGA